MYNLD